MTNAPAYQRAYMVKWRARRKATGLCKCCGRRRRQGVAGNGLEFSQCLRCIARHAKAAAASAARARRRGGWGHAARKDTAA